METLSAWRVSGYGLEPDSIAHQLQALCRSGKTDWSADAQARQYYRNHDDLLWVDRYGADERADSLLACLQRVSDIGMTERSFLADRIRKNLERLRQLDFDAEHDMNHVMAHLEFDCTTAYLRYVAGQRYGFYNPSYRLNHLDFKEPTDSVHRRPSVYKRLFDVPMAHPDSVFYETAFSKVRTGQVAEFLREVEPADTFYLRMKNELKGADEDRRRKLLCNMERRRWRTVKQPDRSQRCLVVNIPAFMLYGYGPKPIEMRVAVGAYSTKSPLLTSEITHLEVNPQWHIPQSIIKNDVARHAGDSAYFARHRYYIADRKTGQKLNVGSVSRGMLLSGGYRVSQEGGAGNSLGRIIFRFPNDFSVYLHDTSSPGVFARENRSVSHGCIRVQRPFDLACYLLASPDEWLLDKIRIGMDMQPQTERGLRYVRTTPEEDRKKLITWQSIKPNIPVFITYYTIYPDLSGHLQYYPDIYGYDRSIWETLQVFMK